MRVLLYVCKGVNKCVCIMNGCIYMCVCSYECIYERMNVEIIYVYLCVGRHEHVCMNVFMYVCMYVCKYVFYVRKCICIFVCIYICMYVCM